MRRHAKAWLREFNRGTPRLRPSRFPAGPIAALALVWSLALCPSAGAAVGEAARCPNELNRVGLSALLPDCRAYEQVSPVNKFGNEAGRYGKERYAWATDDGDGILYATRGPMGITHRGNQNYAVGHRLASGWSSESAAPRGTQEHITLGGFQHVILPSADLSRVVFGATGSYVLENPFTPAIFGGQSWALYLSRTDLALSDAESIDWFTRPRIPDPVPAPGEIGENAFQPMGASPDLSTVYFSGQPTLVPEDAERDPGTWGLYEYSNGQLVSAGTLPGGALNPRGAAPANAAGGGAILWPEDARSQVSADGSIMYFLSPDPTANAQDPSKPPPQLYVRRDGLSRLVSSSESTGEEAPSGVAGFGSQHVYGAADGNLAYFRSVDALTAGAPDDGTVKLYRYDVASGAVGYIAGVEGMIAAASDDGQRFLFGNDHEIAVWDHGAILPVSETVGSSSLAPAQSTPSGSAFVFSTTAPIAGFNSAGRLQIYRYDIATQKTTCVSCPPDGIAVTGPAEMSSEPEGGEVRPNRGFSEDGRHVFFASPDPLLTRDTNGRRDVYEWSEGVGRELISSGRSQDDSFFLDSSKSGNDVFFTTTETLLPSDTDGAYDVYDARVGGGFATDAAAPCRGEGCFASPSPLPLLPTPGSSTLSAGGNSRSVKVGARKLIDGRLTLKIAIPRAGSLAASGKGLQARRRSYAEAGRYTLELPLKAGARRALRDGRRLELEVHLRFSPRSGNSSSIKLLVTVGS